MSDIKPSECVFVALGNPACNTHALSYIEHEIIEHEHY